MPAPDIPDLTGHPTVEAVHFGEASGITGLHHRPTDTPAPRPARPKRPAAADAPPAAEADTTTTTVPDGPGVKED